MFRHRRPLRRWAARVLLLWLFGVASGFANACLVPAAPQSGDRGAAPAVQTGASPHQATPATVAHHHEAGQTVSGEHSHGTSGTAAKSNCQDFCEKFSVSISPPKSPLDDLQGHALAPPTLAVGRPVPVFEPLQRWVPRRDGVRASSIPIAFLRLTL